MSTVEEIVKAVKDLPPQEQAEVKRRLEGLFTQSNLSYVSAKTPPDDDLDQRQQKSGRLEDLFGSVSLGHPSGANNESIDRDLAWEYAATHEETHYFALSLLPVRPWSSSPQRTNENSPPIHR